MRKTTLKRLSWAFFVFSFVTGCQQGTAPVSPLSSAPSSPPPLTLTSEVNDVLRAMQSGEVEAAYKKHKELVHSIMNMQKKDSNSKRFSIMDPNNHVPQAPAIPDNQIHPEHPNDYTEGEKPEGPADANLPLVAPDPNPPANKANQCPNTCAVASAWAAVWACATARAIACVSCNGKRLCSFAKSKQCAYAFAKAFTIACTNGDIMGQVEVGGRKEGRVEGGLF